MTRPSRQQPWIIRMLQDLFPRSPSTYRTFLLEMLPRNARCVEIGVHLGDFADQILRKTRPRELHLIDPWRYEQTETYQKALYGGRAPGGQEEMDDRYRSVCERFARHIRQGRVKVHRGDSADILAQMPDDSLDWVYIDGNHLYEYVRADLDLSLQKVRRHGLITGDDYTEGGWWHGGVKRAVDEFIRTAPVKPIIIRDGQFVLQKSS